MWNNFLHAGWIHSILKDDAEVLSVNTASRGVRQCRLGVGSRVDSAAVGKPLSFVLQLGNRFRHEPFETLLWQWSWRFLDSCHDKPLAIHQDTTSPACLCRQATSGLENERGPALC